MASPGVVAYGRTGAWGSLDAVRWRYSERLRGLATDARGRILDGPWTPDYAPLYVVAALVGLCGVATVVGGGTLIGRNTAAGPAGVRRS